jgi:hypothetical protein
MASKVNLDIAEKLDITCRRGDSFELSLTLKDSSGTAIQLATLGHEFLMDVKGAKSVQQDGTVARSVIASSAKSKSTTSVTRGDGTLVDELTNGFVFSSGTNDGLVVVTATADVMREVPVGRYSYDIQQKVGEAVTTILKGSFKVNEDISD